MRVNHYERVPSEPVRMDGALGCRVRWLIGDHGCNVNRCATNPETNGQEARRRRHAKRHQPSITLP
jgi:hypothetical protein